MAYPDLVTRDEVREALQIPTDQTGRNNLIDSYLSYTGRAIMDYTGREFVDSAHGSGTRYFTYWGGGFLDLAPFDLRSITTIKIDTDGTSPSPTTLTADEYRLHPRPNISGTYTHIELRGYKTATSTSDTQYSPTREVQIVGTWGFSSVPDSVKKANLIWLEHLLTSVHKFSTNSPLSAGLEPTDVPGRIAMPGVVRLLLDPYKRRGL